MRLAAPDISTEASNVLAEQSFGIGNIGIIFDILRNKMYQDPILAVVREIVSNARDAHREAGKADLPIEVHLPTTFDQSLKIKDYGPGISPERVRDVFVNYAASTKREDDTLTGGFGIGSKSPFAYSDTFSVITIVNGIKRTYTAYIDESQVGKLAQTSEAPTDESNGTTIIVPTKKQDIKAFSEALVKTTEYWNPRPKITGLHSGVSYKDSKILFSGTGWWFTSEVKEKNYNYSFNYNRPKENILTAVSDGIPYELDLNQISLSNEDNVSSVISSELFKIKFEIGELSLSASRDSIHYDDKTKAVIKQKIKLVDRELKQCIQDSIANCPSYLEACVKFINIYEEIDRSSHSILGFEGISWRGNEIRPYIYSTDFGEWAGLRKYSDPKNKYNYYTSKKPVGVTCSKIVPDDKMVIYHNDKFKNSIPNKLIQHLFSLESCPNIYIISTPEKPTSVDFAKRLKEGEDLKVEYNFDLINLIGAKKLSSVEFKEHKSKKDRFTASEGCVVGYEVNSLGSQKNGFRIQEISSQEGIYVTINEGFKSITSGNLVIDNGFEYKRVQDFLGKKIHGFTPSRLKKLGPGWKPLDQVLKEEINKIHKDENVFYIKRNHEVIKESSNLNNSLRYLYKASHDSLSKDSFFCHYIRKIDKISEKVNNSKYCNLIDLLASSSLLKWAAKEFDYDLGQYKNCEALTLLDELDKRYSLLRHLPLHNFTTVRNSIVEYIKIVDTAMTNGFNF